MHILLSGSHQMRLLEQIDVIGRDADIVIVDGGRTPNTPFLASIAQRVVLVVTPDGQSHRKTITTLATLTAKHHKIPVHVLVNRSFSPGDDVQTFAQLGGLVDPVQCAKLHFLGSFPFAVGLDGALRPDSWRAQHSPEAVPAADTIAARLMVAVSGWPTHHPWGVFAV